eukprot:jgi/Orpsp1_1/1183791/evm.model.c7180000086730.1
MTFDEGCVKEFEFTRVKQNGNILKCKMIKSKPSDGGCGDDHVYIWSSSDGWKNDLTMVGKYVKTPGRGGTNTMEFFNTDVYIDGVTGKQTISSKSVDYSHTTAGSYDVLSFNNVEIYKGSWDVPLGISFVSGSGTSDDPYITEWTKSRENGTILSSIHSGDQINGVEVLEKTDSTIKFSSNQDKRFRKDNSGICHVLNEAMTFDELSSDTAIYIFSKNDLTMVGKYVKTPGRGGTNTMEFFNTDVYIDGVTGKQTISSKSVDYSHKTAGSYDELYFNNAQIYRGGWDVPLGITFVSGSGTSDDPYITEWTKNRVNGIILSSIHSGDQINGVEVLEKTDSTIKFSSNQDKCFKKDNSGICHVLNEAMTFDELSSDTAIYIFSNDEIVTKPENDSKFPIFYIIEGESKALIKCSSSTECEILSNVSGYYINNGDDKESNPLIYCGNDDCETISVSGLGKSGFFIHNGVINTLTNSLIKCINNDGIECSLYTPNENDVFINQEDQWLIQCYKDTEENNEGCIPYVKDSWNDDIPEYFVNAGSETDNDYSDDIIKCTSEKCEINSDTTDSNVFLNGNLKDEENDNSKSTDDSQLIICEENPNDNKKKCYTEKIEIVSEGYDIYYDNTGDYIKDQVKVEKSYIKCTKIMENVSCTISTTKDSNSNPYPKNAKIFYCYFDPGSGVQHYPSGIKTTGWNETDSSIRSCIDKVNSWGTSINFCDPGVRNTPSLYGYCGWCASWCTSQCEESFCRHINNAGPYEITTYENEVEGETEKGKIVKADFSGNESRGAESMVLYEFKYECQFQKISDSIIYGSSFCKAGFYINNNVNNSLTKALIKCINNDGIICS